jgi:ABC-type Mn2+/Zn2+ transport system ATPase subunit
MAKIKIERIEVIKLFGYFNYNISKKDISKNDNLFLLYGDNGSGKTTILKTVFYLLSSQDRSGHKSELAKTKFEKVIIYLNNGISIGATRNKSLIGSFTYIITKNNKILFDLILKAKQDDDHSVILAENSDDDIYYHKMIKFISELNIKLFYLSDTRKTMKTGLGLSGIHQSDLEGARGISNKSYNLRVARRKYSEEETDYIELTIKALEDWIRSKALTASKAGDRKTNTIYLEIVNQISNSKFTGGKDISSKIENFKKLLSEVNTRTRRHAKYGLISKYEYSQISTSLEAVSDTKKEIIYNVLEPFIRGINAKLDEQEDLQLLVSSFIDQMNSFYSNKKITYTLSKGFKINHKVTKEIIEFRNLSSGEKQLILLFCNTILASSQATIFIIDEPEISLNIKWQRKLLNTLFSFRFADGVQFLIATHSIELLTSNNEDVIKLENISKG